MDQNRTLVAKRAELDAANDRLNQIFAQAGDSYDMAKVTVIAGDAKAKVTQIKALNDRAEQLRSEVDTLATKLHPGGPFKMVHPHGRGGTVKAGPLAAGMKGLTEGSGSGSFVVPPDHLSEAWDRLAAASVGLASGFTVIDTLRDEVHIPRITADAAAAWTSEATNITGGDPTIDEVIARPRKVAALVALSNEVILDSNPSVLDVVEANVFRALGLKLDAGFFEGTGTAPEIRGLKNIIGTQTVSSGANGATPANLDIFADAIGLLSEANADATAITMHPRTWKTLSKIKEITGSTKPVLQESAGSAGQGIARSLYGVPVYLTSQLSITETQGTSTDCSSAYVYEASEVVAVRREDLRVELNGGRLFNSDQQELRAVSRWDVVMPNPLACVRITGIRP